MTEVRTEPAQGNRRSRVIVASLIGTSIEFYDFYIYGTAAVLVFPKLFFPNESATAAQLSSFVTFALAFFARPVGSLVFGHFGDRIGRKRTLVSSLLIMGIATVLIGCLPTYALAGLWAPALLAVLRFVQGVGLGGEWSGATLLATENAPEGRRGLFGSLPQLGAPIGFFLANGIFLLLTAVMPAHSDAGAISFESVGWRIPFLLSAILVIVGLYVRLQIVESSVFTDVAAANNIARVPAARLVRVHWRHLVLGTLLSVSTYVLFYLMTTFTLTYGTAAADPAADAKAGLGFSRTGFLTILLFGVVFFALFTAVAGLLTDRIGRRRTMLATLAGVAVFGLLFQPWFTTPGSVPLSVSFVIVGLALMGLSYGPMGSLLPELFPADVRYTGSAIVYNLAGVLGASLAPIIAVALWQPDGTITNIGLYLSAAGLLSFLALLGVRETRDLDYTAQTPTTDQPPAPVS